MASVFLEHPSSFEHDTGGHPEQAARIVAIERELDQRDWLGFERVRSPAVDREVLDRGASGVATWSRSRRSHRAGGGALDPDTVASAGSFEAALHAAGGAVRMVELLLDGETRGRVQRPPAARPPRDPDAGDGLLPVQQRRRRGPLRARSPGARAGDDRRLGRPPRQRHQRHLPSQPTRCCSSRSISRRCTRARGPPRDIGEGAGRASRSTCRCRRAPATSDFCSLVDDVVVPLAREYRPQLVLISAGYDAHRDDPLADCTVTEEGFAAMTALDARRLGVELGAPVGCVLEGGYALGALGRSVAATMEALVRAAIARPPTSRRGRWSSRGACVASRSGGRASSRPAARARPPRPARPSGRSSTARRARGLRLRGSVAARWGASAARHAAATNGPQCAPRIPSSASGATPTGVASTGTSQASASSTASPKPSRSDGTSTALAAFTHRRDLGRGRRPERQQPARRRRAPRRGRSASPGGSGPREQQVRARRARGRGDARASARGSGESASMSTPHGQHGGCGGGRPTRELAARSGSRPSRPDP